MAENPSPGEQNKAAPPKNGSKSMMKILGMVLIVVDALAVGGGTYLIYASTMGWHTPSIREDLEIDKLKVQLAEDAPPLIYTMHKFTVNLGGEPKRTIQIEVNLQMLSEDGFEEVMVPDKVARARDKIVRILNDKEFAELETIQGKLFLKDNITVAINSVLNKGIVKDVFFSSFVVQ